MPKYDLEFKKKCIELFKEKKTLPKIEGVLPKTLEQHVYKWIKLEKLKGETGYWEFKK